MGSEEQSDPPSATFFNAIPWCASRLSSHPSLTYWNPPWIRVGNNYGDQLFSETLNTPSTIPKILFYYSAPPEPKEIVNELCCFMSLEKGIGGFPGYIHGGAIMTILDEVTGLLSSLNRQRKAFARAPSMTGYLNTRFLKPVKAPSVVLTRARIVKVEKRKVFIEGTIEDAEGMVLSRADAVFITLKNKL